ncbi:hypothetical protein QAD02_002201 [Eretmocerus hayati]|uniref:Uncharacterized protein n=1 Tax=Eretmocerus hayati TaxID=131215 RepID=A0ACC2NIL6_9HYME|nr:hypothetical protein QAD02_002201 [Eretmocerus hayati]
MINRKASDAYDVQPKACVAIEDRTKRRRLSDSYLEKEGFYCSNSGLTCVDNGMIRHDEGRIVNTVDKEGAPQIDCKLEEDSETESALEHRDVNAIIHKCDVQPYQRKCLLVEQGLILQLKDITFSRDPLMMSQDNIAHFMSTDMIPFTDVCKQLVDLGKIDLEQMKKLNPCLYDIFCSKLDNGRRIYSVFIKENHKDFASVAMVSHCLILLRDVIIQHEVNSVSIAKMGDGLDKTAWAPIKNTIRHIINYHKSSSIAETKDEKMNNLYQHVCPRPGLVTNQNGEVIGFSMPAQGTQGHIFYPLTYLQRMEFNAERGNVLTPIISQLPEAIPRQRAVSPRPMNNEGRDEVDNTVANTEAEKEDMENRTEMKK